MPLINASDLEYADILNLLITVNYVFQMQMLNTSCHYNFYLQIFISSHR